MLVRNWMCHPPISVKADAPLQEAVRLLTKHNIHMYTSGPMAWIYRIGFDSKRRSGIGLNYCMQWTMKKMHGKSINSRDHKVNTRGA